MSIRRYEGLDVLVGAENSDSLQSLIQQLQDLGFTVETAGDGVQVMEKMAEQDFHLLFLELELPRMDGFETCQLIKDAWPSGLKPLVFGITGSLTPEVIAQAKAAQLDDLFLDLGVQLENLSSFLDNHHPSIPSPPGQTNPQGPSGLFDIPFLDQLFEVYDPSLLAELAGGYLSNFPAALQQLHQSIGQREYSQAREQAHKLKGSGAALGIKQPTQQFAALEKQLVEQQVEELPETLRQIEALKLPLIEGLKKRFSLPPN